LTCEKSFLVKNKSPLPSRADSWDRWRCTLLGCGSIGSSYRAIRVGWKFNTSSRHASDQRVDRIPMGQQPLSGMPGCFGQAAQPIECATRKGADADRKC